MARPAFVTVEMTLRRSANAADPSANRKPPLIFTLAIAQVHQFRLNGD
jgi:hypothetical protein